MKTLRITLDPGHGGGDPGAVSPFGLYESNIVLDIALRAEKMLSKACGIQVMLTRNDDTFLKLSERADLANVRDADRFISLHCNSYTESANGFEAFHYPGSKTGEATASRMLEIYQNKFPKLTNRGVKNANFSVLRNTWMPAVLMEFEFIHTKFGHDLFSNESDRQKMAEAVFEWALWEYKFV